jgi:hypothetical protein
MNIRMINNRGWKRFEELAERLAWNVGEGRSQSLTLNPVVAFGAQIDLPVAGKLRWIQNAGMA